MSNPSGTGAKNIVLSGYYGFNNVGDEAVLAGLIRAFRDHPNGREGKLRITVLSADPAATEREHGPGVAAFDRRKIGAVRGAIADCDLFASGGGSLLQDVTSAHSIFYYLGVVRAAQMMGKKTMLIAQGIGPLRLARSRKLTAAVASRCQAITVRDAASAALLRSIGVSVEPIVTADPALLLGKPFKDIPRNGIALSLRDWPAAGPELPWQVAHALPAGITTLSSMRMSTSDASVHAEAARQAQGIISDLVIEQGVLERTGRALLDGLIGYASRSELVIGMRLHALILAAACGVPSVALSYDPKIDAFMRESGQEDAIFDIKDHSADSLAGLVGRVWAQRQQRASRLKTRLPQLRKAAALNAEIALGLL